MLEQNRKKIKKVTILDLNKITKIRVNSIHFLMVIKVKYFIEIYLIWNKQFHKPRDRNHILILLKNLFNVYITNLFIK